MSRLSLRTRRREKKHRLLSTSISSTNRKTDDDTTPTITNTSNNSSSRRSRSSSGGYYTGRKRSRLGSSPPIPIPSFTPLSMDDDDDDGRNNVGIGDGIVEIVEDNSNCMSLPTTTTTTVTAKKTSTMTMKQGNTTVIGLEKPPLGTKLVVVMDDTSVDVSVSVSGNYSGGVNNTMGSPSVMKMVGTDGGVSTTTTTATSTASEEQSTSRVPLHSMEHCNPFRNHNDENNNNSKQRISSIGSIRDIDTTKHQRKMTNATTEEEEDEGIGRKHTISSLSSRCPNAKQDYTTPTTTISNSNTTNRLDEVGMMDDSSGTTTMDETETGVSSMRGGDGRPEDSIIVDVIGKVVGDDGGDDGSGKDDSNTNRSRNKNEPLCNNDTTTTTYDKQNASILSHPHTPLINHGIHKMKEKMDRISNDSINTTTAVEVVEVATGKRFKTVGDSSNSSSGSSKQSPQQPVEDILLEDSNTCGGISSSSTKRSRREMISIVTNETKKNEPTTTTTTTSSATTSTIATALDTLKSSSRLTTSSHTINNNTEPKDTHRDNNSTTTTIDRCVGGEAHTALYMTPPKDKIAGGTTIAKLLGDSSSDDDDGIETPSGLTRPPPPPTTTKSERSCGSTIMTKPKFMEDTVHDSSVVLIDDVKRCKDRQGKCNDSDSMVNRMTSHKESAGTISSSKQFQLQSVPDITNNNNKIKKTKLKKKKSSKSTTTNEHPTTTTGGTSNSTNTNTNSSSTWQSIHKASKTIDLSSSSPNINTEFDIPRAKIFADREKDLIREHSHLLRQSKEKAGEGAAAGGGKRRRKRSTTAGTSNAAPPIVAPLSMSSTISTNRQCPTCSCTLPNNNITSPTTATLNCFQKIAHNEQQHNKKHLTQCSDAEIERTLIGRLARLEKSAAWFDHLCQKVSRELKRHRRGILEKRRRVKDDGGEGEVWVEGGDKGEEGGVWRKRRKRPRFLQDVDLSNGGTNEEFVPPLSRSLVTKAKNRTFVFRRKHQPTLTQMVGSDASDDDDNEKEVESGIEIFASDEVEPSTIVLDGDDDDEHGNGDIHTVAAEGNDVSIAFDAEAVKADDVVIEIASNEIVVLENNTNSDGNDNGSSSMMIDLKKASRGGGEGKSAFWWDASSRKVIPPREAYLFNPLRDDERQSSSSSLRDDDDDDGSGGGDEVLDTLIPDVKKIVSLEDDDDDDDDDDEHGCGLDHLLDMLVADEGESSTTTNIEPPPTPIVLYDNTSPPSSQHQRQQPHQQHQQQLTPKRLSISRTIEKDILQLSPTKLHAIKTTCPNWKENIHYALTKTNVSEVQDALTNVRRSTQKMLCVRERVETVLNDREVVLELYKRVLMETLGRLRETIGEGGNGGDWSSSELVLLDEAVGEDDVVVIGEASVVGCGLKEALLRLSGDDACNRMALTVD